MCIRDRSEAIQRLAAAQGIDVLNLIKTPEQLQQDQQKLMGMQSQMELVKQAGQFAGTPLMDPEKNPDLADQASGVANIITGGLQQPPQE